MISKDLKRTYTFLARWAILAKFIKLYKAAGDMDSYFRPKYEMIIWAQIVLIQF
jgi:hypothetical protein